MLRLIVLFAFCNVAFAQSQEPINWKFGVKKVSLRTYHIWMTAILEPGWNIYSQNMKKSEIGPLPTTITFNENSDVMFDGGIKEEGKLKSKFDPVLMIQTLSYVDSVTFVQVVKVPKSSGINASGIAIEAVVNFMVCTSQQCTPPKHQKFHLVLN